MSNDIPTPSPQVESDASRSANDIHHDVESSSDATTEPQSIVVAGEASDDDEPGLLVEETSDDDVLRTSETVDSNQADATKDTGLVPPPQPTARKRKKRREPKRDAKEQRLLGRRALCKQVADIAPHMLKRVKLRILGQFLESTKGMNDGDLTNRILKDAKKLVAKGRIIESLEKIDPDVDRRNLKEIILFAILLQEETHSLDENRLEEKVLEYEKALVKRAKKLDFFDPKKHDAMRWHHYDTYRLVLDAAWRNQDDVSYDEAALLRVLRGHLNISREEHWLIGAHLHRFPKAKCALHSRDEVHDARKELQRESLLWSYRDENNRNIDVIPFEVVMVLREQSNGLELQRTNYRRILEHDAVRLPDLRTFLQAKNMDRYGNKADLIERIVTSDIKPSNILDDLDRSKLSDMCRLVGLKSSGNKSDFQNRLIEFYDDLTFEERATQDKREEWYNNYELLASRSYSDLKAKKLIVKDLDIEHQFEEATDFLFEVMLNVKIDKRQKVTKADGRIPLDNNQVILWDNKSVEAQVNLQDHLDDQFDSYLRKEREKGNQPLAFLVIGPSFTPQSIKLAHRYKAKTNWDVALIEASALKHLADQWKTIEPKKPFPIRLLNRTEVIDKERVEFMLSLA